MSACAEHQLHRLGYIAAAEDAQRRMRRGERQRQCPRCKLWLWPDEWRRPTSAQTKEPKP